jgi:hypothetical protein
MFSNIVEEVPEMDRIKNEYIKESLKVVSDWENEKH